MLVRAEIVKKTGNKYIVSVPSFAANDASGDWTTEAMVCYAPGNINEYKKGDIVWCELEGFNRSKLVIMGKMYIDSKDEEPTNKSINESLTVSGDAEFNGTVIVDGVNIKELITKVNNLSAKVTSMKEELTDELTVVKDSIK